MTYNYSFSGTDVKAVAETESSVFALKSLATISFQVNEQKSPVRRLGRQHVVGFTRSIKTIAGTMVFVILNDHPLKELMPNNNLTLRHKDVDPNTLPYHATNILPFNLRLKYKTEHSYELSYAELFIEGIEITSQSIVTSVNDMVTELVVQFLAKDYKEFNFKSNESILASRITDQDLNNDLALQEIYQNEQEEIARQIKEETNLPYLNEIERTNSNFDPWGDQLLYEIDSKAFKDKGNLNPESLDKNYLRDQRDPYNFDYLKLITYNNSKISLDLLDETIKQLDKFISTDLILLDKYVDQNNNLHLYPTWSIESNLTLNNNGATNDLRLWYNKEIERLGKQIQRYRKEKESIKNLIQSMKKNKDDSNNLLKKLERI